MLNRRGRPLLEAKEDDQIDHCRNLERERQRCGRERLRATGARPTERNPE